MELLDIRIDFTRGNSQFSINQANKIKTEYKRIFRKTINTGGCKTCLVDALFELHKMFKSNQNPKNNAMSESKFSMKPGKLLGFHGYADDLSEKNCTYAKAIALLKAAKAKGIAPEKLLPYFERFPDNYRALIDGTASSENGSTSSDSESEGKEDNGGDGILDAEKEKRERLEAKTKKQLRAQAEELTLPEEEYENLNKAELVEYLMVN